MKARFFYKTYIRHYNTKKWQQSKFTPIGKALLITTAGSGILGIDTTSTTIYQLFTFVACVTIIAFVFSYFFKGSFTISRKLPQFATVGEKLTYEVEIKNNTNKTQPGLSIEELMPYECPTFSEFINSREPIEHKRNWWDRKVMYHRFGWLLHQNTKAHVKPKEVPVIGPRSYAKVYVEVLPQVRGYLSLEGVTLKRTDPFGLFNAFKKIVLPGKLLILPKRYHVPSLQFSNSSRYNPGGVTLASAVGNSYEFLSLRDYRPGDPVRMIHWKSLAKTGELVIKENEDEYFTRHGLILDTFSQQASSRAFETAVSIAASFACTLRTQESLLDLMIVEDQSYCFSSGRGIDHTSKMLEILACAQTCSDKQFSTLEALLMSHIDLLSGCILVLLDLDDERKKLIEKLRSLSVPVLVLIMKDDELEQKVDFDAPLPANCTVIDVNNPEEGLARL